MSSAIEKVGIINIIDEAFDGVYFNGEKYTPYSIENNSTILSFLKKAYSELKNGNIYDSELLDAYKEATSRVLLKLEQIESERIYEYNFVINNNNDENGYFVDLLKPFFKMLWEKYVKRDYSKTLLDDEQKRGYYEIIDGENTFNGYRENIAIGINLTPSYENDKVSYNEINNKYFIRFNGITPRGEENIKIYYNGEIFRSTNDINIFYGMLSETLNYAGGIEHYVRRPSSKNNFYKIYFAFENGFVVDDLNEYQNLNGNIYDLFVSLNKALNSDDRTNYFQEHLKRYFYSGVLNRYREKKIIDKETGVVSTDLNFDRNSNILPGTYETLSGKGENIGGVQTIDFDKRVVMGNSEYHRLMFSKSYYNVENNEIKIFINKKRLTGLLSKLKKYDGVKEYLNFTKKKYNNLKKQNETFDERLLYDVEKEDELEEILLKEMLFAVEPVFWPTNSDSYSDWNKKFFVDNVNNFQKVYFYSDDRYVKEDELLKQISIKEGKNAQYSKTVRKRNISLQYDDKNLIINLKYEGPLKIDNEDTKIYYLGEGYINLRKVPQKFKDNKVSKLIDNEYTNINSHFESEEFTSTLDDREISVVHITPTNLNNTKYGYTNSIKIVSESEKEESFEKIPDNFNIVSENNDSIKITIEEAINKSPKLEMSTELEEGVWIARTFPKYKYGTLYNEGDHFELECTEFANYNDLNTIKQIKVVNIGNNNERYLFNVKNVKKILTKFEFNNFNINDESLENLGLTNIVNGIIYIPQSSLINTKNNEITLKNNENESFEFKNEDLNITYADEEILNTINYISDVSIDSDVWSENTVLNLNTDEYYVDKEKIDDKYYTLYVDDVEENIEYRVEYRLILDKTIGNENIYINKDLEVEILDFVQTFGRPPKKELRQEVYRQDDGFTVAKQYEMPKERKNLNIDISINVRKSLRINRSLDKNHFFNTNIFYIENRPRLNVDFILVGLLKLNGLDKKINIKKVSVKNKLDEQKYVTYVKDAKKINIDAKTKVTYYFTPKERLDLNENINIYLNLKEDDINIDTVFNNYRAFILFRRIGDIYYGIADENYMLKEEKIVISDKNEIKKEVEFGDFLLRKDIINNDKQIDTVRVSKVGLAFELLS